MPDARPLIAADKADAIETWLEALEGAAANLRRVLDNVKAAQADLERNDPRCSRAALKFVVLDNLRSAQSGPMVNALAALGRLMYALADAEDATPL